MRELLPSERERVEGAAAVEERVVGAPAVGERERELRELLPRRKRES